MANHVPTIKMGDKIKRYEGKFLCIYDQHFINREGKPGIWETVGRPWSETSATDKDIEIDYGGVDVIATANCLKTGERMILIEKIYRIPLGKFVLSFPAGFKDSTDKDPFETALRELKEETGYVGKPGRWFKTHRPDPWKSTERGKLV